MQVVLVMFRGNGERRSFSITREVTVVGRREDCDFRIPLGEISRKHCRLLRDGEGLRVEDLGSSNGTYHNGERVQTAELQAGDTLQVGPVAFVLQIDGVPGDDELQPVTAGSRKTAAPLGDSANGDVTLQEESGGNEEAHEPKRGNGHDEFDPMSVLESEGSGALPAIDDSQMRDDVMIDLASNGDDGGSTTSDHA